METTARETFEVTPESVHDYLVKHFPTFTNETALQAVTSEALGLLWYATDEHGDDRAYIDAKMARRLIYRCKKTYEHGVNDAARAMRDAISDLTF